MILAISGSPRRDRMIHTAMKEILKGCNEPYEIISLAGKKISGCIACTACASDNICKVRDDWNEIGDKMKEADIIIFGAPNYYAMPNALSHCCLERTFCFRHMGTFSLEGKLGVTVTTLPRGDIDPVKEVIDRFMLSNRMEVIGGMNVIGYSQCYTCGEGKNCLVGSVVGRHGVLEEIEPQHLPLELCQQSRTMEEVARIRELLKTKGVSFE